MTWADGTIARSWSKFQPPGENFSAFLPQGGKQTTKSLPFGDHSANVNYYVIRDAGAMYELLWLTGPSFGETDLTILNQAYEGFIRGVNVRLERAGEGSFQCEAPLKRNISSAGYTGLEFDLSKCTVPVKMRLYTRVVGNERHFYGGQVLYEVEDEKVSKFLKSFTVLGPKSTGPKSSAKTKASTN
jgi:hypothetical protein